MMRGYRLTAVGFVFISGAVYANGIDPQPYLMLAVVNALWEIVGTIKGDRP